jgi:hypothetical protein
VEGTDEELFNGFGEALDEWAREVKDACRASAVQQKQLAIRLTELPRRRTVDQSRVSKWLSGRRIVTTGGAALPGKGLSQDIVRALGLQGPRARRIMQLGERIDLVQAQLERRYPSGWRVAAQAHFRNSPAATPHASPPAGMAGQVGAEPSSDATVLRSLSAVDDHHQGVPDVPTAPPDQSTATASATPDRGHHSAASEEETAGASQPVTEGKTPDVPGHGCLRRPRRDQSGWVKTAVGGATVLAAAVIATAAVVGADGDGEADGRPGGGTPQASTSEGASAQTGPETVPPSHRA